MAELVDAVALGATAARRAGSSPVPGTTEAQHRIAGYREAVVRVLRDSQAALVKECCQSISGVFRTAAEHVSEVAQGQADLRCQRIGFERSFPPCCGDR
jgi:hypothetical protein